jgi:flagellar biosynthetic protein FlhB
VAAESEKDQKTEEATPRRLEEAREKGQVAMSQELVAALMTSAGFVGLVLGGPALLTRLGSIVASSSEALADLGTETLTVPFATGLVRATVSSGVESLVALLLPVVGVGLVVAYGQIGFRFAPKAVAPDFSKLNPVKGVQRLFSLRSWMRTGLSAVKIAAIASAVVTVAVLHFPEIVRIGVSELGPLLAATGRVAMRCGLAGVLVMLAISLLDLIFQRLQHKKDLRMTKEEVKEEHKTTEGDPHVRARVRSLQREAARRRMMSEVPDATVVVTNPDHYAVALSYPRDGAGEPLLGAPRVVAKGADHLAQRIKAIARDAGVLCYEDVPLARTLYAQVEIGEEIPEDLYTAVAAVLNYVYRIQGSTVAA